MLDSCVPDCVYKRVKTVDSVLNRLNKNSSIIALQDASISLVPMILTVTLLLMAGELLAWFTEAALVDFLRTIHLHFYVFFPLIFTVSLSVALAKSHDVDFTTLVLL